MSDSLLPHGLQHDRPFCPLPTPGVHSDSRPSSRWCHPAISSSVILFSSCPQGDRCVSLLSHEQLKAILGLFISVQLLSHFWLFATPWTPAHQASLSTTNSWILLKLMSIELVMPYNHRILWQPLLLLPSIFPSIRVFSNKSALLIRLPKYWIFSFNISPSIEHSGLISFRMDWLDLLIAQGTLRSLLQHHSSKASVLWHSACFIVQLSHPYWNTKDPE